MKHFYTGLDILIFILGLVIIISSTSAYGETSFSKQKNLIASNGLHTIKDHYKIVIKQIHTYNNKLIIKANKAIEITDNI